jgi:hypothetical protein
MATENFRAGVTYGDWEGTVSADDADQRGFRDLLVKKKLLDPNREFLLGASIYVGASYVGKVAPTFVHAVIHEGSSYDDVAAQFETAA